MLDTRQRYTWLISLLAVGVMSLGVTYWLLAPVPPGKDRALAPPSQPDSIGVDRPAAVAMETPVESRSPLSAGPATGTPLASDGSPADSDVDFDFFDLHEFEVDSQEPEDPLGYGACSLFITVVCGAAREPVSAYLWLIRIDAPGNGSWTRGDQIQARVQVSSAGMLLGKLPEGMYRIACWDQPTDAVDADAFLVSGERTEVVIVLPEKKTAEVRLAVIDHFGDAVQEVFLAGMQSPDFQSGLISWLQQRSRKLGPGVFTSEVGEPEFGLPSQGQPMLTVAGLVYLGTITRPTRAASATLRATFLKRGHNLIELDASYNDAATQTWVASRAPLELVRDSIWLEAGGRPDPRLLRITGVCQASPRPGDVINDPGAYPPIAVKVEYPDCVALHFNWTPALGPLGDKYLVSSSK